MTELHDAVPLAGVAGRGNDTVNAGAHILLPAAAWGEKDGTVTNTAGEIQMLRRAKELHPAAARVLLAR